MVLAFNSKYNKDTRIQNDVIMMERSGKYLLQERINFRVQMEREFEKEDEAYQAFEKIELP